MATRRTITSANSVFMLGFVGYYPTPFQVVGYSADEAFDSEDQENAETLLGVDGIMSVGWLPAIAHMTIMLQADSPTMPLLEDLYAAENAIQDKYQAFGTLTVKGTARKYTLQNGVLKRFKPLASGGRTLRPRGFSLDFNNVAPANM